MAALVAAMSNDPYFSPGRERTSEEVRKRVGEYTREYYHMINPVDLSEREFIIHGEKIMAHDRKTALKIYARRHPETKKKRRS